MMNVPSSACILIVEDEYSIRDILMEVLEDEGYPVTGAANGQEALTYLRCSNRLPMLILLDLNMPIMSGWEFRQALRADPTLRQIPVVVVSASTTIAQQRRTLQADSYLAKPLDLDMLIDTVERYCTAEE